MRAKFMLPSATYTIILSQEDLVRLLENGYVSAIVNKNMPCTTGRSVWNPGESTMETLDQKDIYNGLMFNLSCDVADIPAGDSNIQFLNIAIEKGESLNE